ncbi:MAG: M23 family metallopeptidase [Anaerolineae bacterium]|nr:M23 family metallopeptidase [Candidatus Roseilinea sp.]MDW8451430.1 M23 family metallopeptidase [Anaerolineae bacterium]
MPRPTLLVSLVTALALLAAPASSPIAAQEQDALRLAFEAVLPRLNARAAWGESYTLGEVASDGRWAFAIAEPIPASGFAGFTPHIAIPLIGIREAGGWLVIAPSPANAAEFNALLHNLPAQLADEATKAYFEQPLLRTGHGPARIQNFTGHKLPWRKSLQAWAFSKDVSGHVNQVDFDIQGLAATGDVLASKPGVVVFAKESSNAGACGNFSSVWRQANMVVVQHGPNEYSWYVHLEHNSVPVNVGDVVSAGTKLGVEGDTGFACGKHVHFMVSSEPATWTNPADPNAAPWPKTNTLAPVDFVEVPWSGIQNGQTYISQNDGAPPPPPCPAPGLQTPADGAIANEQAVAFTWAGVNGCAYDGRYVLRVRTAPDMDAGGTLIAEAITSALSGTPVISTAWNYRDLYWSVRANGDGAAWAAARWLRIEPAITGVYTLYGGLNFTGAAFTGSQTITDLQTIGLNDWAQSLILDPGVGVILCSEADLHGECGHAVGPTQFTNLDDLAQGLSGSVSSVRACGGACPPGPLAPTPTSPVNGQLMLSGPPIALRWQGAEGERYRGELSGGALTTTLAFGWITGTQWLAGPLPASETPYVWRVRASNGFGDSAWAQASFVVTPSQSVYLPITQR